MIGGDAVLPAKIENDLKALKVKTDRVKGSSREETALAIAKRLDGIKDVSEIAVVNGTTGLADAVSVAAAAAEKGMPILLANPKSGLSAVEKFIKEESIKSSFIIGGDKAVSNEIAKNLPGKQRIEGSDRNDTNAKVIEKFYADKELDNLYLAKDGMENSGQLIDALAVGALAAKNGAPVLIASKKLNANQVNVVNTKKIATITQVGGKGNEGAFNQLKEIEKAEVIKVKNEAELQEALKKANANDTIEIDANATISKDVTLSTNNAIEINVKGDLTGKVTVKTPNADIKNSGTIGTLVVENGKNTTVTNTSAGKIDKVEVSSSSENVKVENNGTITEVKNDGEGTKVDNEGTISKPITGTETPNVEGNKPGGSTGGGSSSGGGSASYDKIPTDAISLNGGNFNTHKGNNYTGVNVGWSLKDGLDFNDIKSIEVELYAGNKKLVTNVAEGVALEKHKELYSGGTRVFSTPFAFGEFKDDYWAFGNWEENIKEAPTKATIIINGKAGDKVSITTTSGLSSTEGTKWEQLFDNKEIPTDAIILENFNTHKGTDYTGVNVGWSLKEGLNFDDIKSIEVELYSGTEKLATNTAVLKKHAELYKTTKQFSTPFAFDGFEDEYWTFSEWNEDKAKKPTSAKVIIKGKAGDTVVATNNGPLSTTSGTEWDNLFDNEAIS